MKNSKQFVNYLDFAVKGSLLLFALSAPISIAATQTAWALALLFVIIRAFLQKPTWKKEGIDLAILAFIGLSLISSIFSYEPEVSLRKMVGVSLVTIVYLFSKNLGNRKTVHQVILVLLISATFVAIYAVGVFVVGKNLKVWRLAENSPLKIAGILENDTIQKVNGMSVSSPDEIANIASENKINKIRVYRYELFYEYDLSNDTFLNGGDSAERLGILEWSRGRDERASGLYGHYTTYAEVLQLIASLALGLLIVGTSGRIRNLLIIALIAYCAALFLTVTRASWLSFIISASVMVLFGASRRTIFIYIACTIPIILGGLFYLQQKRNVSFVDVKDGSIQWRLVVWREGVNVLVKSPWHLAVGIGMDSLKTHWQDWHMFDNGNLPLGHMHCTPLALAFERGVPTLIAWIIWMFIYLKMLWQTLRKEKLEWIERGILMGSLGGTIGFLTSSLVHYNWGDSEVVMIFYLLMGVSLAIIRSLKEKGLEVNKELVAS